MTKHKTGMSALAKYFGNSVYVVDVGINSSVEHPLIINHKQRMGSGNIRRGPAMTPTEARYAMSAGIEAVETAAHDGVQLIGIGEMGIGNTTTSAAVLSAITGADANTVTGRGSGLTDSAFELKKRVITEAIKLNKPNPSDIIDVISKVSGFDIAAMTNHEERRDRVLLLNKQEINKWKKKVEVQGITIVPLKLFIDKNGLCKVEIALCKGKHDYDKRESIKEKDNKCELDRIMKSYK